MKVNLLKSILNKSAITGNEKDELMTALETLDKKTRDDLGKFLEENPAWIEKLSNNLKAKKEAVKNQDMGRWNEIVKKEVEFLEKLNTLK